MRRVKVCQMQVVKTGAGELMGAAHGWELLPDKRKVLAVDVSDNKIQEIKNMSKELTSLSVELRYVRCHTRKIVQQGRGEGTNVECL